MHRLTLIVALCLVAACVKQGQPKQPRPNSLFVTIPVQEVSDEEFAAAAIEVQRMSDAASMIEIKTEEVTVVPQEVWEQQPHNACLEDDHKLNLSRREYWLGTPDGGTATAFIFTQVPPIFGDGKLHDVSCLTTTDNCTDRSCVDYKHCCDRGVYQ